MALSSLSRSEPVVWTVAIDRDQVEGDNWFVARVEAHIEAGYHLYAATQPPGGPRATRIALRAGQPFAIRHVTAWPPPVRIFDPKFGMDVEYHTGTVLFDFGIQAEPHAGARLHELVLAIEFQLCDEYTCLRPDAVELRAAIRVIPRNASSGAAAPQVTTASAPQSSMDRYVKFMETGPSAAESAAEVRRILSDDPGFTTGYSVLASRCRARGDWRGMRAVLRRGLRAGGDEATLRFAMIGCTGARLAARRVKLREYARRFPRLPQTVVVLQELAATSRTPSEKRRYLERALRVTGATHEAVTILRELCPVLAERAPARAARLAKAAATTHSMPGFVARDVARALAKFYGSVARVHRLLRSGRGAAALRTALELEAPVIPHLGANSDDEVVLRVVRTRALAAAGLATEAYQQLVTDPGFLEHKPLIVAGIALGRKLGMSQETVMAEAWRMKIDANHPPAEFVLPRGQGSLSARSYRGKVLLLNAWNPG